MEEFGTKKLLGIASGVWLILLLMTVDGVMIFAMAQMGISILTFILALLLLVSLGGLGLLFYWLYGLIMSGYRFDRNALIINWGATAHIVPMGSVTGVLTGSQAEGIRKFRGGIWPGHLVGYGQIKGIGPTLFFATGRLGKQVIITTPALAYALSPADAENFLQGFRKRLSLGPTQAVEQISYRPEFFDWSFWSDRLGLTLLSVAIVTLIALFGYICWRYPSLQDLQPLHFNASGEPDRWGTRAQVFTLPFIGLLALVANGGLGILLYQRERPFSYLLWSGTVGVQILVWGATLGLLR